LKGDSEAWSVREASESYGSVSAPESSAKPLSAG
jgi:hypothetical protein